MSIPRDANGTQHASDVPDSAMSALAEVRGEGADAQGNVRVVLDGRGRLAELQISSLAAKGSTAALETSIREAFDTAFEAVEVERAALAPTITRATEDHLTELQSQVSELQQAASRQLDDALSAIAAAAARIGH